MGVDGEPSLGLKQCYGTPGGPGGATLATTTGWTSRRCEHQYGCKFAVPHMDILIGGASELKHAIPRIVSKCKHNFFLHLLGILIKASLAVSNLALRLPLSLYKGVLFEGLPCIVRWTACFLGIQCTNAGNDRAAGVRSRHCKFARPTRH